MPTYQYACTECGHRFEQVQAFTDPSLTVCPECAGKLRKVYGAVGVVFKGSGFYRNDARAGSGGKSDGKESAGTEKADKPDKPATSDKTADKTPAPVSAGSGSGEGSSAKSAPASSSSSSTGASSGSSAAGSSGGSSSAGGSGASKKAASSG